MIDLARFDGIAAYLPADDLVRHLASLASTIQALMQKVHAVNPAAGISADLADEVHALAGRAGLMGFVRLASSAAVVNHLAHGREAVTENHVRHLLRDMADSLAETQCRLHAAQAGHTSGPNS